MKKTLLLLLAAATLVVPCTLTSCGGGGGGGANGTGAFVITNKDFVSGARGFAIQSNSGWQFWSTGQAGDYILSNEEQSNGTVVVNGYMQYGFNGSTPMLYGVMRYRYDAASNTATIKYSMDATNYGNFTGNITATEEAITKMINTIHDWGEDAENSEMVDTDGDGVPDTPWGELSTHFAHTTIVFDFNSGTCVWTCGCGHQSQTMDFLVRKR